MKEIGCCFFDDDCNNIGMATISICWYYTYYESINCRLWSCYNYFFGLLCIVLMGYFGFIHIKATQPNASQNTYMMGMWLFYCACLPFPFFKANNNNIPSLKVKDLNHLWKVIIRIYIYIDINYISLYLFWQKYV